MLVIRMQRTGRKGHAQFRVVVQDSRRTPTSGNIVAGLGHYNPHTKETSLDKEKASFYLEHGAQPSERVARLLKAEGVKLPKWVVLPAKQSGKTKNVEKRRSTRPAEPKAPKEDAPAEPPSETPEPAETPEDDKKEASVDSEASEKPAETNDDSEEAAEPTSAEPDTKEPEEAQTEVSSSESADKPEKSDETKK